MTNQNVLTATRSVFVCKQLTFIDVRSIYCGLFSF